MLQRNRKPQTMSDFVEEVDPDPEEIERLQEEFLARVNETVQGVMEFEAGFSDLSEDVDKEVFAALRTNLMMAISEFNERRFDEVLMIISIYSMKVGYDYRQGKEGETKDE